MNCKNLKFRSKNKRKFIYCSVFKKEIIFNNCNNCPYKEYKQYNTLRQRTNKQNKKEKNRFIICSDLTKCAVCGSKWFLTLHEIFGGRNRSNSIKYGLVIPLCLACHRKYQEDKYFNEYYHKLAQDIWESKYGTIVKTLSKYLVKIIFKS